jgi:hypothetical protein
MTISSVCGKLSKFYLILEVILTHIMKVKKWGLIGEIGVV